jgi:hypothetical protein
LLNEFEAIITFTPATEWKKSSIRNLNGMQAKPYQVKQVRAVLVKYGLIAPESNTGGPDERQTQE